MVGKADKKIWKRKGEGWVWRLFSRKPAARCVDGVEGAVVAAWVAQHRLWPLLVEIDHRDACLHEVLGVEKERKLQNNYQQRNTHTDQLTNSLELSGKHGNTDIPCFIIAYTHYKQFVRINFKLSRSNTIFHSLKSLHQYSEVYFHKCKLFVVDV